MRSTRPRQNFFHAVIALACLLATATPALAQSATKPAAEKWRPKQGPYAWPDKDFQKQCDDIGGDVVVEFAEKHISGHEWGCTIDRLDDIAPGSIRMHMTCSDYNLAQDLNDPNWENRTFKEVMTLDRIDDKTMFVRKTLNGKYKGPRWKAAYCPEATQSAYRERKAHDAREREEKEAAERKAAEERKAIDERVRKAVENSTQKAADDRAKAKP